MIEEKKDNKVQKVLITATMLSGGFFMLESAHSDIISGFQSISFKSENQKINIYQTHIKEVGKNYLILDISSFIYDFKDEDYQISVKFKKENGKLAKVTTDSFFNLNKEETKEKAEFIVPKKSKNASGLPSEINIGFNEFSDMIISSDSDDYIRSIETIFLSNYAYSGWMSVRESDLIKYSGKKIAIPHYLFISAFGVPNGVYDVRIEANNYDIYTAYDGLEIIDGSSVFTSQIKIYQNLYNEKVVNNFVIETNDTDWLNKIYEISLFYDDMNLADLAVNKYRDYVNDDKLIIDDKEFDQLFPEIATGDYYFKIKANGYAEYTTPDLIPIVTSNKITVKNEISLVQVENNNLVLTASDKDWLNYVYGITFHNNVNENCGTIDWRNNNSFIEKSEDKIVIGYSRLDFDMEILESIYGYEILSYRSEDNFLSTNPLIVMLSKLDIDFEYNIYQNTIGDLVIESQNSHWIDNIYSVSLENENCEYTFLVEDCNRFSTEVILPVKDIIETARLIADTYRLNIVAIGYHRFPENTELKLEIGLPEATVNKQLNIFQNSNNDLVIESNDIDWANSIENIIFRNQNNNEYIVKIKKNIGGYQIVDGLFIISNQRLIQDGIVNGDYSIEIESLSFQNVKYLQLVKLRNCADANPEDLFVYQDPFGAIQIVTESSKWLNSLSKIRFYTNENVFKSIKVIDLLSAENGVYVSANTMHIPYINLLKEIGIVKEEIVDIELFNLSGQLCSSHAIFINTAIKIKKAPEDLLSYLYHKDDLVIETKNSSYLNSIRSLKISNSEWYLSGNTIVINKSNNISIESKRLVVAKQELTKYGVGFGKIFVTIVADHYEDAYIDFDSNFSAEVAPTDVNVKHLENGDFEVTSSDNQWLSNIRELIFETLESTDDFCVGNIVFNDNASIETYDQKIIIRNSRLNKDVNVNSGEFAVIFKVNGYLDTQIKFNFIKTLNKNYRLVNVYQDVDGDFTIENDDIDWVSNISKIEFYRTFDRSHFKSSLSLTDDSYGIQFYNNKIIVNKDILLGTAELETGYYQMSIKSFGYDDYRLCSVVNIVKGLDNSGFLTYIYVEDYPKQMVVKELQQPNLAGLTVYAQYSDGTINEIDDYKLGEFNSTPGLQDLDIYYHNKVTSFKIEVLKKSILKLSVSKLPIKILYLEGDNLDLTGFELTAFYDNDTSEILDDYVISGYDSIPGLKKLKVYHKNHIAEFNVKVVGSKPVEIRITRMPFKTKYLEGDAFEVDGLEVSVYYNNNTSRVVNDYLLTGFDITPGTKEITVLYETIQTTFKVFVKESELISIKAEPIVSQLNFIEGAEFDSDKIRVTALYSNNTTKEVKDFEYSGYDFTPGIKSLQIVYQGKSDVINVRVLAKKLEKISVVTLPSKLDYFQGEMFDCSGIKVEAYYDNGSREFITNFDVLANLTTPGQEKVKIIHQSKIDFIDVDVKKRELTHIFVTTKPNKFMYLEGDEFDATGIVVTAFYNDNSHAEVKDFHCSGYDSLPGIKEITVIHNLMSDCFDVEVNARELIHIQVTSRPFKIEYDEGDNFSDIGLNLTAYYNNGTTETINEYTVSGYDSSPGFKRITVSYCGKSDSFEVTVKQRKLTNIKIITLPTKTHYIEGEKLDTSGIEVMAYYRNDIKSLIRDFVVEGYNDLPGTKRITISYQNQTDSFNVEVSNKQVVNICASLKTTKLNYLEGELFDHRNLQVVAFYNNGTDEIINNYLVSGYDSTPGSKVLTVNYDGKTDTVSIDVLPKTIIGIKVIAKPYKTVYLEGDEFDKHGMIVFVIYSNETTEEIVDYTYSGYNNFPGEKLIQIEYQSYIDSFNVKVVEKRLEKIEVTSKPAKLTYLEGEEFDSFGMIVTAYYNNSTNENVIGYLLSGYDSNTGTKKISVTYKGFFDHFNITVIQATLIGVSVYKLPHKLSYLEGDLINVDGLEVRALYNNDTFRTLSDYELTGYNSYPGTKSLQVVYNDFSDSFNVEVLQREIIGISVTRKPEKLIYLEGENIILDGMLVTAFFNNNTKEIISDYLVSGYDSLPGNKSIVVSHNEKTDIFNVSVIAKKINTIEITEKPNKLVYLENEEFDSIGLVLTVYYDNGTNETVDDYDISGFEDTPGKKRILVTYRGKVDFFYVDVLRKEISYIVVSKKPDKLIYIEGENFDATGMEVVAHFNNETSEVVTNYDIDGFDALPGHKELIVSYQDQVEVIYVNINVKEIESISVIRKPNKLVYLEGEQLDLSNMLVKATYNNGTIGDLENYSVSGYDYKPGTKRIVITSGNASDTFIVSVKKKVVSHIVVVKPPEKLIYIEGETFNSSGMLVMAIYNNGEERQVENYEVNGFDYTPGIKTITVVYKNTVDKFPIEVVRKQLVKINVEKKVSNLEYVEGSTFNPLDFKVIAHYNNDTRNEIDYFEYDVDGFDSKVGVKYLKFTYLNKWANISLNVRHKKIASLSVVKKPNKRIYEEGENLQIEGMIVEASYDNGTKEVVYDYALGSFKSTPGDNNITITYQGLRCILKVKVTKKVLDSISVTTLPSVIEYLEGDAFDPSGMMVTGYYSNKTTDFINDYTVSGYDASPGIKKIAVESKNKKDSFIVKVNSRELTYIDIVEKPEKLVYIEGEKLDLTNLIVRASYNNNTIELIDDYKVEGFESTPGSKKLIVSYMDKITSFEVIVRERELFAITVSSDKPVAFVEGEKFDRSTIKVLATYNNNTSEYVTNYNVSGYSDTPGKKQLIITVDGKTGTYNCEVIPCNSMGLSIAQLPERTLYIEGEKFDKKGLEVLNLFKDGTSEVVIDYTLEGYDSTPGEKTITITYTYRFDYYGSSFHTGYGNYLEKTFTTNFVVQVLPKVKKEK